MTLNSDAQAGSSPRPGRRLGPRPLLLHLALATMRSSACAPVWPSSNDDWQALIAKLEAAGRAGPGALGPDAALIRGIAAYRRHPWTRDLVDPPAIWTEGESRLLDFGTEGKGAPPLLLVPSLVNRATILDLAQGRSMARYLAGRGLRVLLLDWGWPDAATRTLGLDALITGRLARAMAAAGRVTLVGYCMGGLLALAAAQHNPAGVAGLALLATPWDFQAGGAQDGQAIARLLELMEPAMAATGTLPVDALQLLFSIGDLHAVGDKYRSFGRTPQDSPRARQFVSFEDWLNDGVPLAAPVARQCLSQWYGANAPAAGQWRVDGQAILPAALDLPCFVAVPGRDRIVPPESAMALARMVRGAVVVRPSAGHVGMVAGADAEAQLWQKLADWALALPRHAAGFRKPRRGRKVSP